MHHYKVKVFKFRSKSIIKIIIEAPRKDVARLLALAKYPDAYIGDVTQID